MSDYIDTSENFHPYECEGAGKCRHCDRAYLADHDPYKCALCDDGAHGEEDDDGTF